MEVSAVETEVIIVPGEYVVRTNRQAPFKLELRQPVGGSPAPLSSSVTPNRKVFSSLLLH